MRQRGTLTTDNRVNGTFPPFLKEHEDSALPNPHLVSLWKGGIFLPRGTPRRCLNKIHLPVRDCILALSLLREECKKYTVFSSWRMARFFLASSPFVSFICRRMVAIYISKACVLEIISSELSTILRDFVETLRYFALFVEHCPILRDLGGKLSETFPKMDQDPNNRFEVFQRNYRHLFHHLDRLLCRHHARQPRKGPPYSALGAYLWIAKTLWTH